MSVSIQIEKLGDDNYDVWSILMRSVLITADLWKVVCGQYVKPEDGSEDSERWNMLDQKALASLFLNLKATQLMHIKACTTAADAWKKLCDVHLPGGPIRKVQLYQKLSRLRMLEGDNVVQYVNKFAETVNKLAEMDITINDELKSIMLLSSLPNSWENFVVAIETRDTLPTFETVKVKLLEEGARKQERDDREGSVQAVYVHTKLHGTAKQKQREENNLEKHSFKGKCYICEKFGHRARECPNKERHKKLGESKEKSNCLMHISATTQRKNIWCVDSGATSHMCCDKGLFTSFINKETSIMLAANKFVKSSGIGTVMLKSQNVNIELRDVIYVPSLHMNFLSVSKSAEYENITTFDKKAAVIKNKQGEVMMRAMQEDNLYLFTSSSKNGAVHLLNDSSRMATWHNRFGHLNFQCLKEIKEKELVIGMDVKNMSVNINCDTCNMAKIHVLPFPQNSERATQSVLELVHSDVCGPMNVSSLGGNKYFVTFIDDYSRKIFIYFMHAKNEVFDKFKLFKSYVECQTGKKIKALRSDNGTEYVNRQFTEYLNTCGIKRQLTVPYTPQQNGVAERANRTIVEMAKSMLIHAKLEEFLWAEAVSTASYLRNRCPSKALMGATPFEIWQNRKPSVKHLRVFGSRAFALDKTRKSKFQAKGKEYIFVGYSSTAKAYRLYDREKRIIVARRDVKFVEGEFESKKCTISEQNNDFATNIIHLESNIQVPEQQRPAMPMVVEQSSNSYDSCDSGEEEEEFVSASDEKQILTEEEIVPDVQEQESNAPRRGPGRPKIIRSGKSGRPRKQYNSLNYIEDIETPQCVGDALRGEHAQDWKTSMQKEYDALISNNTWTLCDLPPGQKAIGSKWVFRVKRDKEGNIQKFKSRLVAQGCGQKMGVNYSETFSPVIRYETIRMLFAIAAEKQLCMHQVDISNAYLNGRLQEEVYMRQPQNFIDEKHPNKVLKLQKAIYGLKQSGRVWNDTLDEVLKSIGFKRSKNEACLYAKQQQQQHSYIAVYVDDLIIISYDENEISAIKRKIANKFDIHDGGQLNYFLGMEIQRESTRGSISLCQKQFIINLLDKYGMQNCRPAATPLDPGYKMGCRNENCVKVNITQFQSLIGSLMYLAVLSRPDILHTVSKLSQRNTDPHSEDETAAKHVLRYLSATVDLKITYSKSGEQVMGFADADWANDLSDRKSYSGYAFFLGGSAFSWTSAKQSVVAMSSTEAEYVALSTAAKEAVYLRRLLLEIGWSLDGPITICGDNISSHHIAKNPVHHKRTKHIDIKYHFVREKVECNEIILEYVPTDKNVADVLTKGLCKQKQQNFTKLLGLN